MRVRVVLSDYTLDTDEIEVTVEDTNRTIGEDPQITMEQLLKRAVTKAKAAFDA